MVRARVLHSTPTVGQISQILQEPTFTIMAGIKYTTTTGINDVDRTDSRIMKIIELPYAPFEIIYNSALDEWSIPTG